MVTFVCYHCDKTLKKNQVDKHTSCRPLSVICIDCSTTFHGQDYKNHISCLTQKEKYFGDFAKKGNNKPKPNTYENKPIQQQTKQIKNKEQQGIKVGMQVQEIDWKWKNQIKRVILQNQRKIEYESLKEQVIKQYKKSGGVLPKEEAEAIFEEKIKKLSKVKFVTYVEL